MESGGRVDGTSEMQEIGASGLAVGCLPRETGAAPTLGTGKRTDANGAELLANTSFFTSNASRPRDRICLVVWPETEDPAVTVSIPAHAPAPDKLYVFLYGKKKELPEAMLQKPSRLFAIFFFFYYYKDILFIFVRHFFFFFYYYKDILFIF